MVALTHDTKRFRLDLGDKRAILGLPVGKHVCLYAPNPSEGTWNGKDDPEGSKKEIERKYTPVTGDDTKGYVDLVIKVYRPGTVKMADGREVEWANGGKMGIFLDKKEPGDYLDINGPFGVIQYLGRGMFKVPGGSKSVGHVGMMAGGTGITPMLQILQASLLDPQDSCKFSLIYANKTEDDILVRELIDEAVERSRGRFNVTYTLDFPPASWSGPNHKTGFITADMIKECLPAPAQKPFILMCGPPPMVEFACKKNLEALAYPKELMMNF